MGCSPDAGRILCSMHLCTDASDLHLDCCTALSIESAACVILRCDTELRPASLDELVGAGEHGRHCGFGSATVEAPNGCEVASNRLASITKFATMLTTDIRNGANRRVSATGARAISISRP